MAVAISRAQGSSPGIPIRWPGSEWTWHVVCTSPPRARVSEHGALYTQNHPSLCPGCPAHFKNIQLGHECSVRLSGAGGTRRAAKRAFTRPRESPSKASLKLRHHRKLARPCLRDTVQLPKGLFLFFCFKYQNYKNQFINFFSPKQPPRQNNPHPRPESKQKQNTVKSVNCPSKMKANHLQPCD